MPGIAADQHGRSGNDPAADRTVEFGDPGGDPLGQRDRMIEPDQRDRPPAALQIMLGGEDARHLRAFLDQRVPLGAVGALALPAAEIEPQAWQT